MVLSKKAYNALPYAYLAGAVLSVLWLESPIKYLSALILLSASLLILAWRRSEQRRIEKARLHRRPQRMKIRMQHSSSPSIRDSASS